MREKYKLVALVALLVVFAYQLVNRPVAPNPAAAAAASSRSSARSSGVKVPDPTLRADLLERAPQADPSDIRRNIFDYKRKPPPPAPPPEPLAPPPPPPAPVKYYGFTQGGPGGGLRVFLTDGEEIYLAVEGDIIKQRFRIARVTETEIEVVELNGRNQWTVALEKQ